MTFLLASEAPPRATTLAGSVSISGIAPSLIVLQDNLKISGLNVAWMDTKDV